MGYLNDIFSATRAVLKGMKLTMRHALHAKNVHDQVSISNEDYFAQSNGIVTLEYPHEQIPVPTNGRYKLHNEIDDCIVCDKCAKICPVDCIDIEPIKSPNEIGVTSDGTSKRLYAAVFDIDMAKCCFCGLCTTVCPTECLTMTPDYDFSVTNVSQLNFGFGNMTEEEIVQRKAEYEAHLQQKSQKKEAVETKSVQQAQDSSAVEDAKDLNSSLQGNTQPSGSKPVFKPKMSPTPKLDEPNAEIQKDTESESKTNEVESENKITKPKPVFKPKMTPKSSESASEAGGEKVESASNLADEVKTEEKTETSKPVLKPKIVMKPKIKSEGSIETIEKDASQIDVAGELSQKSEEETKENTAPKPKLKPLMTKKKNDGNDN